MNLKGGYLNIMKRKFIGFTDEEINILADALEAYGTTGLLEQVNDEIKEREYIRKRHEEWANQQTKIYCC